MQKSTKLLVRKIENYLKVTDNFLFFEDMLQSLPCNYSQEYMFIFSLAYPPHAHYILWHCIHFSLTKLLTNSFFCFFFRSCRSSGVAKDQLAWCEHGGGCGSRGDREKDGRLQWC